MNEEHWLTNRFEEQRTRLKAVAMRLLGSEAEADDAVQEAWLRLHRTGGEAIDNLGGWLTTVVSRICLDHLRSRRVSREDSWDESEYELSAGADRPGPEDEALLADALGPALLMVLEALSPPERVSFVLHDLFGVPFDEIGPVVDRSAEAARQLASRARRRLRGAEPERGDTSRGREVVEAFLAAVRRGDFDSLLSLLDPNVMVRGDAVAVALGGSAETKGRNAAAALFGQRARGARLALVDGRIAAAGLQGAVLRIVLLFTIRDGSIVEVEVVGDRGRLDGMTVEVLE